MCPYYVRTLELYQRFLERPRDMTVDFVIFVCYDDLNKSAIILGTHIMVV